MPAVLAMVIQRPGNFIGADRQDRQQRIAQAVAGLAEALHVDAGLAALVGDQFVVAIDLEIAQVLLQWRQQFAVHLPLVTGGQHHGVVVTNRDFAGGVVAHRQFNAALAGGGFFDSGQGTERVTGDARDFLTVEDPVDAFDQVDVHDRVVGVVVLVDQTLTLAALLLEHQVGELRREHFVDERAVVRRLQRRAAQDHVDLYRREAVVEVDEGFRRALPAADDRDAHRLVVHARLLGHLRQILRMVEHATVILQRLERFGNTRRAAGADHHGTRGAHVLMAGRITGNHAQRFDLVVMQHRLNGQHFFAVAALPFELRGDPAQVIVVLHAARIEGAQVDEVHQAPVGLEVIDE
ncbi:hypothetical protein D3C71_986800 [compost metagenome]